MTVTPERRYADSADRTVREAKQTFYDSLEQASAKIDRTRLALAGLRDGNSWVELDYNELLHDIATVSAHLAALGIGRGDVVCLQLPNWTEAVIYTYAVSRLGAVVCPVTTIYRQRELEFILRRTQCKVLVVPSKYRGFDYAEMAAGLADGLPDLTHVIAVGESDTPGLLASVDLLQPTEEPYPACVGDPDDVAVIAFTSGTTGESKGVMHSHASMHSAVDDFVAHAGFGDELTSLVMSPFGHLTGFTWGIVMPLRGSGNVVLLEAWQPEQALDLVERYGVTFTMGATPFLSDLLDAAKSRSRACFPDMFVCAGAPIPPSLIERAVRDHDARVVSGWGMSEYPIGTSTSVTDDPVRASSSDGRPAGRAEIAIVDAEAKPVPVGQEGDLLIRGPGLFRGYYKRPDLDEVSLTPEGFLRTGDRARLLDDLGHIRISGRTKDIIIRGGENIPVVEIENLLLTHPAVRELALVPIPHERLGETACACVVLNAGHETVDVATLAAFLAQQGVAKQFFPESVRIMTELPRTPSGKIQKFALRELVRG